MTREGRVFHNSTDDFKSSPRILVRLAVGFLLLIAVIVIGMRLGEGGRLLSLLVEIQPMVLLLAAMLQCVTYACVAALIHFALAHDGKQLTIGRLFPLALAKQFVSQAVPSVGLSGNLMVIRGLERRGIARSAAVRAVLVNLMSYYLAFAIVLVAAIAVLWFLRDLTWYSFGVDGIAHRFDVRVGGAPSGWAIGRYVRFRYGYDAG